MEATSQMGFREVSENIYKNYRNHGTNIKQCCVKSTLISLEEFYNGYKDELKVIQSELTPCKDSPTNADFVKIFKAFEEYPANIQKPKKPGTKEHQRLNSTLTLASRSTSQASMDDGWCPQKDVSGGMVAEEEYPAAAETYREFKKFQQNLDQLLAELQRGEVAAAYKSRLQQLEVFAAQLEKLVPTGSTEQHAFSAEEEAKLGRLVGHLEELNFIYNNQDVFQPTAVLKARADSAAVRLDNLLDVISYTLMSLSPFNAI